MGNAVTPPPEPPLVDYNTSRMPPATRAAKASMLNGGADMTVKWKQVVARKLKLGTLRNEVSQTTASRRYLE